jgi:hypothetical protein
MVLALLTAWILWLLCRSFVPRERLVQVYLALAFILSFTTGAAWYVSAILADALGPILYFGIFLLIFEADKLSRWEKGLLYIVAFWAAASHPTHLLVAAGFCTVFGLLWLFRWREIQRRGVGLARVALVLLAAIVAQVGVHVRLYHRLSVFGNPPAFLMARLIGDGPARNYLQQHCSTLSWTICTHIKDLPTNEADFLWPSASIWRTSDWDQQEQLRREQFPLLLGTLRSYPKEQIAISWHNFTHMLFVVGPTDFGDSPLFERQAADFIVPGLGDRYTHTRQSRNQLPQLFFRNMERPVLAASMLLAVVGIVWLYRSGKKDLVVLTGMTLFILPVNAFLGGVISSSDTRLQDRVSWMIVVCAVFILVAISQKLSFYSVKKKP